MLLELLRDLAVTYGVGDALTGFIFNVLHVAGSVKGGVFCRYRDGFDELLW